jgi:hypothetical protein
VRDAKRRNAPAGSRLAAERAEWRRRDGYADRILRDFDYFGRLDEGDELIGVTSLQH